MLAAKHLDCNSDDIFNRKKTVLQDMVGISGSTLMQAAKHLDFNSDDIFNK